MGAATFISYSSQDREIALTVCEALENRGVSCWISCRDIGPGENFQVSIVRAIRAAKVMVLVFSANCNNSEEIKKELVLAGRSQLIVIPVRVEDVAPDEAFAYELATRQWVDLFADWESSILRLSRQIGVLGCCTVRSDGEPSEIIKVSVEKTATACAEERAAPFQTKLGRAAQACLRSGALRYLTSMAVLALVGIASTAAWYWHEAPPIQSTGLPPPRQSAPVSLADVLAARFISAVPSLDQISRRDLAQAYQSAPGHKAQAVSLQTAGMWRATSRSDAGIAREAALEECQVVFGNPCVLLAVDEDVTTPPADGRWKAQDMPRARYAGDFDPGQIPGLPSENRNRREFVDYRAARGPKAAVYLPAGSRVFTIVDAESQHAAEERAFQACHDEANGNKLNGNCLLYAVGNRVVLPLRLQEPLAAPMLREVLAARLASADPTIDVKTRTDLARDYESKRLHKAEAASLEPAGTWYTSDRPNGENAEDSALEGCQIYYGQPCILLAVDNAVEPMAGNGRWLHHNMPRVRYAGSYDPKQIPSALPATRERSDILAYGSASGPKAAALNLIGGPGSRLFIVTGATSQRAAEEQALKACNDDPVPGYIQHLCFLYAAGSEVVLARRLRAPLTGAVSVTANSENR